MDYVVIGDGGYGKGGVRKMNVSICQEISHSRVHHSGNFIKGGINNWREFLMQKRAFNILEEILNIKGWLIFKEESTVLHFTLLYSFVVGETCLGFT